MATPANWWSRAGSKFRTSWLLLMSGLTSFFSIAVSLSEIALPFSFKVLPLPSFSARSAISRTCVLMSRICRTPSWQAERPLRASRRISNCFFKSSAVAPALGFGRTSNGSVNVWPAYFTRTLYVPGATFGPWLLPQMIAFGTSEGFTIRMSHTRRFNPALGSIGFLPFVMSAETSAAGQGGAPLRLLSPSSRS